MKSALKLWMLLSLLGLAWGQQPFNPADANFAQNFGTDSINLQNLSIEINVPVLSKPGAIPFTYSMYAVNSCQGAFLSGGNPNTVCGFLNQNNASLNCQLTQCLSLPPVNLVGTWTLTYTSRVQQSCGDGGRYMKFTGLAVIAPNGRTFVLPSASFLQVETGGTACDHQLADYTLVGGIKVVTSSPLGVLSQIIFPDGVSYSAGTATDPFNNHITVSSGVFTDTLGNNTFSVSAQSGATGEIDTYEDTGGTTQQIKQILTAETVKTTFGCAQWPDQTLTGKYAVTAINYPDGNNIGIAYESVTGGVTGRLHQLTLRTGGPVTYGYGSINCASMIPSSLTRTTADGTTTYTFALNGTHGTTTTVLDPGKNKAVYYFEGTDANGLPVQGTPLTLTQVQVWTNQGTVASPSYASNESRTVLYCYNGNTTNCATTQASYPISSKDVYVTLDGKSTSSRTKYTYDTFTCGGVTNGCSLGNVIEIDRYPFTTVGTGTIDNKTVITYGSWNSSTCAAVGSNIVNLPCEVKTTDGAGTNTLSDTRHSYGTKGFETTTYVWTNAGSWFATRVALANTNGTPQYIQNSLGTQTNYSYAATGSGGCNGILPTGTSTTVNSVTMTTGATWNCNMGKLLTSTDANSNTSRFTYDLLGRPSSQQDPTLYTISESYPSATTQQITDSTYFTTTNTVDGLGRGIRSQTTDGSSYDTVSTGYGFTAGSNRYFEIQSSQPCIVTTLGSDCTKNHFTDIDPMGRVYTTRTTSNETATHNFTQNDVQDELGPVPSGENSVPSGANAKTVQTEIDGLGRITSVCALEATGGTACGQFDGNSGILTSYAYSYSAGGTTTTVTRGSQTHTSFVDQLGRLKSISLPESGTTTYTYDSDSSSSAVCANRTSAGALLKKAYPDGSYECYVVDSLGRTTDIGVANSSGINAGRCKRFRFDTTSSSYTGYTAPTG